MQKTFMQKTLLLFGCLAIITACNNPNGKQNNEESPITEESYSQKDEKTYPDVYSRESVDDDTYSHKNNKVKASHSSFVGTYKFQDFRGQNWKLVLKDDETATISLNGEIIDYGTWDDFPYYFPRVEFAFDWDNSHKIYLENSDGNYFNLFLNNGYVYCGPKEAEANHPKKRIKYNKN